jgi:hypothetical protein
LIIENWSLVIGLSYRFVIQISEPRMISLPLATDLDLATWEPTLWITPAPTAQKRLWQVPVTITGTTMSLNAGSLSDAGITPGMICFILDTATTNAVLEILAVTDAVTATVSPIRARTADAPSAPAITGALTASVVTYTPLLDALSDQILATLTITSDRDTAPTPTAAHLRGLRQATLFATLAAAFRSIDPATTDSTAKSTTYHNLYQLAQKSIRAMIDTNNDGIPDTPVTPGVIGLERT